MSGNLLIGKEERDAVLEVFDRQNGVLFAHGADERRNHIFQVDLAEKDLACQIFEPASVVLVSSGTAALKIALKAFGIESGDTVIMQPFNNRPRS
jgi:8-amino-3,8-dideoxy-alpha-D-manno-octulosonate transaminase